MSYCVSRSHLFYLAITALSPSNSAREAFILSVSALSLTTSLFTFFIYAFSSWRSSSSNSTSSRVAFNSSFSACISLTCSLIFWKDPLTRPAFFRSAFFAVHSVFACSLCFIATVRANLLLAMFYFNCFKNVLASDTVFCLAASRAFSLTTCIRTLSLSCWAFWAEVALAIIS